MPEIFVDIAAYFYERFSFDKLDHFSETLHQWLSTDKATPMVYYFHCSHGIDRTGLVSGVYRMKYLKKSLKEVIDENTQVGKRDMLWTTYSGLLWYCEHLQRDREGLDCGERGGEYYTSKRARSKKVALDDEL
jgi:protein-tyrosine phosphatase